MLPVGRVAYRQEEGIGERREQRSVVFCFVFWEKTRRGFQTQNSCPILTEGNLLSCDWEGGQSSPCETSVRR